MNFYDIYMHLHDFSTLSPYIFQIYHARQILNIFHIAQAI